MEDLALAEIENLMRLNGSSLSKYSDMPLPDESIMRNYGNSLLNDELSCNKEELSEYLRDKAPLMTDEQLSIYRIIMNVVDRNDGGFFFLYGFGGTGKTFLWSLLCADIRSRGMVVLTVASSGIAALLLPGGRTTHSRFGIPISLNEVSTCSIEAGSDLAELIKETRLIIWDEAPMMSKDCFEALDRTLRDILKFDKPFGGKIVVLGGDFRQILPVVVDGGRMETVCASIKSSNLWSHCTVLKLTKNMRLLSDRNGHFSSETRSFSKWILDIGDGAIGMDEERYADIDIHEDLLIPNCANPVEAIVREIYGDSFRNERRPVYFQQRAILSPRNHDVEVINNYMLGKLSGEEVTYYSSDSIEKSDNGKYDNMLYSQEFLNSIKVSGLPNHVLKLRVGTPVMLLRNIYPKAGLCNGTRLLVTRMSNRVIEAIVITSTKVGTRVGIPRMSVSPRDTKFPFRMRRRQFPLSLAFAMTINKSQGQTLERVGLFLPKPVFTHGQLYVALSRVTKRSGLKIFIADIDGKRQSKTANVVYTEIFEGL